MRVRFLSSSFVVGAMFIHGCGDSPGSSSIENIGRSEGAVTDVEQSDVRRQSIGNCWVYATIGWAESLHKSATGQDLNASESYMTYWHWFDQLVGGRAEEEVQTGGQWAVAAGLMTRYGVMKEGNFIASEAFAEMSQRQAAALVVINDSIKQGALSTPAARRDRALVRTELNRAWRLDRDVVQLLDQTFGVAVDRTLDKSNVWTLGTPIRRTTEIPIAFKDPRTGPVTTTLAEAIGWRTPSGQRSRYGWQYVSYPTTPALRRTFQKRVQRAMHDRQPVIFSWYVDFNSLDNQGRFFAPPTEPGRQGGHMVVLEDYQVSNVPGFGVLPAGQVETRQEALDAALDEAATIDFFRIKNSWGSYRADRRFVMPGYHDLYMAYLNGPIAKCEMDESDQPLLDTCRDGTPLQSAIVPAGY